VRHLAIGSGKDGNLYLVDRDNLGHFVPGSNSTIYQQVRAAISREFSAPAYFNGMVYFGGVDDFLKAFQLTDALLGTSSVSRSGKRFGYPGATPSVSSNGIDSGIVWAVESVEGALAVLHAYNANNLATELYNSNQAGTRDHFGQGNKFITPVIANGEVFVGTTNGVGVFGLLGGGGAAARNRRRFTDGSTVLQGAQVAFLQGQPINRGEPAIFAADAGRGATSRDNDQVGHQMHQVLLEESRGAPERWKKTVARLRRVWPSFLMVQVLFCGCPVSTGESHLRITPGADPHAVLRQLDRLLMRMARTEGTARAIPGLGRESRVLASGRCPESADSQREITCILHFEAYTQRSKSSDD
jgi:hypothetical protein